MKTLLRFLGDQCDFLFAPGHYRFVDSGSTHSFGNAFVNLQWRDIVLEFALDRSSIESRVTAPERTFSVDLGVIRAHLGLGPLEDRPTMTPEYAQHLPHALEELEHLWADEGQRDQLVKDFHALSVKRSKLWFG